MSDLDELLAQLERAWQDDGNETLCVELARRHPEHRAELYRFAEDLVLDQEKPTPEQAAAEDRVHDRIMSAIDSGEIFAPDNGLKTAEKPHVPSAVVFTGISFGQPGDEERPVLVQKGEGGRTQTDELAPPEYGVSGLDPATMAALTKAADSAPEYDVTDRARRRPICRIEGCSDHAEWSRAALTSAGEGGSVDVCEKHYIAPAAK